MMFLLGKKIFSGTSGPCFRGPPLTWSAWTPPTPPNVERVEQRLTYSPDPTRPKAHFLPNSYGREKTFPRQHISYLGRTFPTSEGGVGGIYYSKLSFPPPPPSQKLDFWMKAKIS